MRGGYMASSSSGASNKKLPLNKIFTSPIKEIHWNSGKPEEVQQKNLQDTPVKYEHSKVNRRT